MRIIIVAGALGSGKTTLIRQYGKYLMEKGNTLGVIENEAGMNPLDADFLTREGFQVRELIGGCICCSIRNDLPGAVSQMEELYNPDILFIEPSGIAAPGMVREMLETGPNSASSIITVVLADGRRMKKFDAISPFFRRCFDTADLVILNKAETENTGVTEFASISEIIPWIYDSVCPAEKIDTCLSRCLIGKKEYRESEPGTEESTPDVGIYSAKGVFNGEHFTTQEDVVDKVKSFMIELRNRLTAAEDSAIGHIKLAYSKGRNYLFSITDSEEEPLLRVSESGSNKDSGWYLNILNYNTGEESIRKEFETVMQGYQKYFIINTDEESD